MTPTTDNQLPLEAQLEATIRGLEETCLTHPDAHRGRDWHELTEAEEEVFDIERRRFPRMMMSWHCYQLFKFMSDATTWDDAAIEQARRDYPQWAMPDDKERGSDAGSLEEFSQFAKIFGGLMFREAWCIYAKMEAWNLRAGVFVFPDELPHAGLG